MDWIHLAPDKDRIGASREGSCEHGNVLSSFVKFEKIWGNLNDCGFSRNSELNVIKDVVFWDMTTFQRAAKGTNATAIPS
jgi:hypothetical protein